MFGTNEVGVDTTLTLGGIGVFGGSILIVSGACGVGRSGTRIISGGGVGLAQVNSGVGVTVRIVMAWTMTGCGMGRVVISLTATGVLIIDLLTTVPVAHAVGDGVAICSTVFVGRNEGDGTDSAMWLVGVL